MQSRYTEKDKVLKIGITGGIGSGKTIVSRIFSLLGVPLYNADDRAKWILANHPEVKEGLLSLFGKESFTNGVLNRSYISSKVFNNKEKLDKLNHLVHPKVGEDFLHWYQSQKNVPYVLKEAALLYEAESYKELDKIITVYSPTDLRISRLLVRDPQRTENDIRSIMNKQMSDEEKVKRADFVIYNNEEEMLIPQVLKIDKILIGKENT